MPVYSSVPVIVVVCYLAVELIKQTPLPKKLYPLCSLFCGAAVGAVSFLLAPALFGFESLAASVISGAASGLAATGADQVVKKLLSAAENGDLHI